MATGLSQTLPVVEGGTGSKTSSGARTNLGIGTASALGTYIGDATLNYTSISANSEQTQTVTVTGVVLTFDYSGISLDWSTAFEDGIIVKQAWISTNDTVSIRVANVTGSPIDPAPIEVKVIVLYFNS